jgi:hypothetical protein
MFVLPTDTMPPLPPDLPPVLEVYYSPTCTPCRLELPAVAELARQDGLRVRIVILDQEERARAELGAVSPGLEAIAESRIEGGPGSVLRDAGNARGILPYARSIAPDGATCAQWSGRLTVQRGRDLLAACARLVTSPRRSRS